MKQVIVSLLSAIIFIPAVYGQDEEEIRSHEIGLSFNLYDFKTAQLIRTTSLNAVIRDKNFGNLNSMSTGI